MFNGIFKPIRGLGRSLLMANMITGPSYFSDMQIDLSPTLRGHD